MDLKQHSEEEVLQLLQMRKDGLALLESLVGSRLMQLDFCGNYEVFRHSEKVEWQALQAEIPRINKMLRPVFEQDVFSSSTKNFGFENTLGMIFNRYEGMLNTGKMMTSLLKLAQREGVEIYNGAQVQSFEESLDGIKVNLANGLKMNAEKLLICTNAFAGSLLNLPELLPARNQVLITKPIADLNFKGAFHAESGHLYFRTVGKRILIGGGRQHFTAEQNTTALEITDEVQHYLERQLRELIIPRHNFEVDYRWAGIIGIGPKKTPLIKRVSDRVFIGVRLGGMGVALGSAVGKKLSELAIN